MRSRSSAERGPSTCSGSDWPALSGDEQAAANTRALRDVTRNAREIGLRLDQHAGPAGLLEMPGLRALGRMVGADLDEVAGVVAAEKLADQGLLFVVGRDGRPHDVSAACVCGSAACATSRRCASC